LEPKEGRNAEMKKILWVLVCSLVLNPLSVPASGQEPPEDSRKPDQVIARFYRDFNFVIAFSTNAERVELAKYTDGKELPEKFKQSRRLARVFAIMKKIGAQVIEEDPKIVIRAEPSCGPVYYSGITEVKKIQPDGDTVKVEVIVYHLQPEANEELIARYEVAGGEAGKVPTEEEMLGIVKPAPYLGREVHTWVQAEGRWKKQGVNLVFVK
jgi:hypothetical protein